MKDHELYGQRLREGVAEAALKHGVPSDSLTLRILSPVEVIEAAEEIVEDADPREGAEIIRRLIDIIVQGDPRPPQVMKNFYALVHAFYPAAMFPIQTCEEYAMLFDEGRAAESWRVKKFFQMLKFRGAKAGQARFQKSATACELFSQLQRRKIRRGARADQEHLG